MTSTLTDALRNGGGIWFTGDGDATIRIATTEVSDNFAPMDGGGLYAIALENDADPLVSRQAVTIVQSLISGNTSSNRGGGAFVRNYSATESLIEDSRITLNNSIGTGLSDAHNGGGLYVLITEHSGTNIKPKFTITGSTIDNNTTDHFGGGIFVCVKEEGNFVMTNSTVSTNHTLDATNGAGGGIVIARYEDDNKSVDAYLRNVTITKNDSVSGGGLSIKNLPDVRVRLDNSIVSGNFELPDEGGDPSNLYGPLVFDDESFNNLVGNGSTVFDADDLVNPLVLNDLHTSHNWIISDTPLLGSLQNNGGLTPTHGSYSTAKQSMRGRIIGRLYRFRPATQICPVLTPTLNLTNEEKAILELLVQ